MLNPSSIKNNKLYKPLVFSVKLIIFVLAIYYIYDQFSHKNLDNLGGFIKTQLLLSDSVVPIIGLVFLQFINYGIENIKWRTVLEALKKHSFIHTQKAVYAGNAIAILTPDRLGTFIGRFTYIKDISKTKITFSTFVGNYAQLVGTLLFALIGLILSWNLHIDFNFPDQLNTRSLISIMIPVCSLALFVFYGQRTVVELIKKWKWDPVQTLINKLEFMKSLSESRLHLVLGLACLRYLVFIVQFHLALKLFGFEPDFMWTISFCGILYLFATLIPSPFMGNLGTREAIAVFLVTPLGIVEPVIAASLFIWLINVVLPSLIGGVLLLKK